jgi:hypothetical protein
MSDDFLMEKTVAAEPMMIGRVVLREGRWNCKFHPKGCDLF